ncbi:hypothetical protein GCM10009639_33270 [Kitasatospora putterlickiae]|uniref:DUF11 domain-containing protein n=1 Tax=Kitasatospora putterlickiae TaxID=221725 RepID=A0ABN1Y372_9ACTN
MRPSTVRRLVRAVPLAAVVAGAAGYPLLPAGSGAGVGRAPGAAAPGGAASMRSSALVAPVAEASAPVFAAVYAAGPAAPSPKAGSTGGPVPSWPEELPGAVAETVDVAIRPLSGSWEARADGGYLDFQVTWTNTGGRRFDEIVPVVRVLPYDHPPVLAHAGTTAKGTLDRKDLDEWREVGLNPAAVGGGPQQGAFALDPGESRAVRYRLTLVAGGTAGRLPISAEALVRRGGKAERFGGAEARVNVTVAQPVRLTMTRATDLVVGRVASELTVELAKLDAVGESTVVPVVAVTDPVGLNAGHGLVPEDLIAEVRVNGAWHRLRGALDADGLVRLDTAELTRVLAAGESAVYPFRFAVPTGRAAGGGLEITVGATVDGGALPVRKARPRTVREGADPPKP